MHFHDHLRSAARRTALVASPLLVALHAHAAGNLVPNPDFETFSSCPNNFSQLALATPWTAPTDGTSDYYNACAGAPVGVPANWIGTQAAFNGDGYAGFGAYVAGLGWREYLEVPLSAPMVAGKSYGIRFWVSLADESNWAIDRLGAYLQAGPVGHVAGTLPLASLVPQITSPINVPLADKLNWVPVQGVYVAAGGEDHLVIGNFQSDSTTTLTVVGGSIAAAYYYVDGFEVLESPAIYCTAKTNSLGCVPAVAFSGVASLSAGSGFTLSASNVLNNKAGLLFFGTNGRLATPFQGGMLCVQPPLRRTPIQFSGGNPGASDCSGVLALDFNALVTSGGAPGLTPGAVVDAQFWYRDPLSPSTTGLSDAAEFVIGP